MKDEIRIYIDPFSLLIAGPKGITRKYTPFPVISRKDSGSFVKGQKYLVHKILPGDQDKLLFEVNGKPSLHSLFLIP